MSGDEKDEKSFLSRWSQRKQDAKQSEADSTAERSAEEAEAAPAPVVESDADEQFDLSSLPKLEEITETTVIPASCARVCPKVCGMQPCGSPGRSIPRSATMSIRRWTMRMTGTRRGVCRGTARSRPALILRKWFCRSWAANRPALRNRPTPCRIVTQPIRQQVVPVLMRRKIWQRICHSSR